MDILFIHPSYPGQFARLAPLLAKQPGVSVCAMGDAAQVQVKTEQDGIPLIKYSVQEQGGEGVHRFAKSFNDAVARGMAVAETLIEHKRQGYEPDVVFVHPGWGDSLYLKSIFPFAKIIGLLEFYYHLQGADVGFDKEFPHKFDDVFNVTTLNAVHALAITGLDRSFSPTEWQRSRFPEAYQSKISVIHDGIDTERVTPNSEAVFVLPNGVQVTANDEVLTFVSRDLEPYRGYHKFMRSLPAIMEARPECQVIIVGGDGVSYGKQPPVGETWKSRFLAEVISDIDMSRLHFTGKLPYSEYLKVLQVSSSHVYLTYPFVLSWSVLEAMAAGCCVIASDTAPVREVIKDSVNGYLVPFDNTNAIAAKVIQTLEESGQQSLLRQRARETVVQKYDFRQASLPRFIQLIQSVLKESNSIAV